MQALLRTLFRLGAQAWLSPLLSVEQWAPHLLKGGQASHDYSWFGFIDPFYELSTFVTQLMGHLTQNREPIEI